MPRANTVAPPSAPLMRAEPDDIPEVNVPPGTLEAPSLAAEAMASPTPGIPPGEAFFATEAELKEGQMAQPQAAQPQPGLPPEQVLAAITEAIAAAPVPSSLQKAHEPLLLGFCQYMQTRLHEMLLDESIRVSKGAEVTISSMAEYVKQTINTQMFTWAEFFQTIPQPGAGNPYQAVVEVITPGGYPMKLTLQKPNAGELITAMVELEAWLQQNKYGIPVLTMAA